ncbi:uncharacterized protein [Montipora foliosa]|uniref:uncharacterized protein n=1 Tax=Montipora foliosa TaxID=591990 RepID=UPI0035F11CCB
MTENSSFNCAFDGDVDSGSLCNIWSHINLHFQHCPEKGLECQIPGCKRIVKRKEMEKHLLDSAMSHLKMQSTEIQRLRREIHEKLVSSRDPQTVQIRILKEKRQEKELFVLQQATLKEGEMWGLNMRDIGN